MWLVRLPVEAQFLYAPMAEGIMLQTLNLAIKVRVLVGVQFASLVYRLLCMICNLERGVRFTQEAQRNRLISSMVEQHFSKVQVVSPILA